MKCRYIRERQTWTREDAIPDGQYYGGYESPLPIDSPVAFFDAPEYLEYSYTFSHDDDGNDGGDGNDGDDGDDEAHQEFTAAPQQSHHPTMQPPPPSTFSGFTPPPEMSPSSAYSAQVGYLHAYMTESFTSFDTWLRCIETELLPFEPACDGHASGSASRPSSSWRSV
ncbi:hypothetical protein Sjap_017854 [Stephania japonica]|uniref:Uncharacterized protein n=1 Tax=Stephania japonica TaxID=461633 RepID=A0AAP0NKG0_9MAGN